MGGAVCTIFLGVLKNIWFYGNPDALKSVKKKAHSAFGRDSIGLGTRWKGLAVVDSYFYATILKPHTPCNTEAKQIYKGDHFFFGQSSLTE